MSTDNKIYLKQLLAGREVAKTAPGAAQMANFMYLIGDSDKKECVIVDPAWDIPGLLNAAAEDDMKVVGALVTHYHQDHVGGGMPGMTIQGLSNLLEENPCPIYVNKNEAQGLKKVTGISDSDMKQVDSDDILKVGDVEIKFIHTPGHTPGSQCFMVGDSLVSGDTLFIGGCGRVDLPGSNPEQMYESLTGKLAKLPDNVILYPGHNYADRETSTMEFEKQHNTYLRIPTLEAWLNLMS